MAAQAGGREMTACAPTVVLSGRSAKHPPGKALRQVDHVGLLEVLHRIAAQHLDAHGLEEQRVGTELTFVETRVAVVQRPRGQIVISTSSSFHLVREVLQYGPRQRTHVHVLRLGILTFCNEHGPHLVKTVIILEARVVALLVSHTGKEQNAHGKPQSEGNDLERNACLSPEQSLKSIIELFHILVF